jgi:hypothetical protein
MIQQRPRRDLVRKLLETACRSMEWDAARGAPPERRLAAALAAHRLEVKLPGLELMAWITEDVELAIWVRVRRSWTPSLEQRLRSALEEHSAVVAGLVLEGFRDVVRACESAARRGHAAPAPMTDGDF